MRLKEKQKQKQKLYKQSEPRVHAKSTSNNKDAPYSTQKIKIKTLKYK